MNLQITLRGKTRNRDGLIRAIQRIARRDGDQIGAWKEGMRLVLCPLGYLDMTWERESGLFGQWQIKAGCDTTPGGPGFHKAVADLFTELGRRT